MRGTGGIGINRDLPAINDKSYRGETVKCDADISVFVADHLVVRNDFPLRITIVMQDYQEGVRIQINAKPNGDGITIRVEVGTKLTTNRNIEQIPNNKILDNGPIADSL